MNLGLLRLLLGWTLNKRFHLLLYLKEHLRGNDWIPVLRHLDVLLLA